MAARKSSAWIPDRPDPRGAAPARLGDLLVGVEAFMAKKTGAAISREEWRALVGERVANRTRVGRLNRGLLTLHVATSAWSNELSFLKQDILFRLKASGKQVRDLRFVVDQLEQPKPRAFHKAESTPQPIEKLPDSLLSRLQEVDDPNLRAAIAQAARYSLRKTR